MLQLTGINLYHKLSDAAREVLYKPVSGPTVVLTIDCFCTIWMKPSNQSRIGNCENCERSCLKSFLKFYFATSNVSLFSSQHFIMERCYQRSVT
jgi:hypothetical protein